MTSGRRRDDDSYTPSPPASPLPVVDTSTTPSDNATGAHDDATILLVGRGRRQEAREGAILAGASGQGVAPPLPAGAGAPSSSSSEDLLWCHQTRRELRQEGSSSPPQEPLFVHSPLLPREEEEDLFCGSSSSSTTTANKTRTSSVAAALSRTTIPPSSPSTVTTPAAGRPRGNRDGAWGASSSSAVASSASREMLMRNYPRSLSTATTSAGGTSSHAAAVVAAGTYPYRKKDSTQRNQQSMTRKRKSAWEELTSLSATERNQILESIHGVSSPNTSFLNSNAIIPYQRKKEEDNAAVLEDDDVAVQECSFHGHGGAATPLQELGSSRTKKEQYEEGGGGGRGGGRQKEASSTSSIKSSQRMLTDYHHDHHQHEAEKQKQESTRTKKRAAVRGDGWGEKDEQEDEDERRSKRFFHEHEDHERQKLIQVEDAINRIRDKKAYNQSIDEWDGYARDPLFLRVFLQAESHDPDKAAARLVSFMEEKLKRFGPGALTRQLTFDDLSSSSKSLLIKKGVLQLLSARDSSDRAVLLTFYRASQIRDELRDDPSCVGDAIFYLLSTMAEDQETQRRGFVAVCVIVSSPPPENDDLEVLLSTSLRNLGEKIFNWCPLKCNAHHHWIYHEEDEDAKLGTTAATTTSDSSSSTSPQGPDIRIFDTIAESLGRNYRLRTRLHSGSTFEECKNTLKTFGIPVDHLPFSIDGSEIRASGSHARWIQKRRQKERDLILRPFSARTRKQPAAAAEAPSKSDDEDLPSCFNVIDLPGRHDVCLGRGNTLHQHSGNIVMRSMMEPLVEEYQNATSSRRQELNKIILQAVHLIGGKFLSNKESGGGWLEVATNEALVEKSIGGIFRSMVSRVHHASSTTSMMSSSSSSNVSPNKIAKVGSFHHQTAGQYAGHRSGGRDDRHDGDAAY